MRNLIFGALILAVLSLSGNGCNTQISDRGESVPDAAEADSTMRGPLSSIDDYLRYSYTGEQWIRADEVKLKIDGLVESPLDLDYQEVLNHNPCTRVASLNCIDGWSVKMRWEGIFVGDLVREAGVKDDAVLVVFHSFDGYQVSIMLKDVLAAKMILAYKVNGSMLPLKLGFPFQLVADGMDGYNWVKGVAEIELQ